MASITSKTSAHADASALRGALAALGATVLWSVNFVIASGLGPRIPPIELNFYRWLVAVIAFTPCAARAVWLHRRLVRQYLGHLVLAGLIGITVFNSLVYTAGRSTSALNLSLISISSPLFMILLSRWVFGESITLQKALGTLVVLCGLVVLVTGGRPARLLDLELAVGDLWMLLASFLFAVYSILVKRKPPEMPAVVFQYATFALGLLLLVPAYLISRATHPPLVWDRVSLLALGYVGLFASLAAFTLWSRAVYQVGPARAGMIYYLAPVSSGILGALVLGQPIGLVQVISMVVIVLGLILATGVWRELKRA